MSRRKPIYSVQEVRNARATILFEGDREDIITYLMGHFINQRLLNREQAVLLMELALPVKMNNGSFITPTQEGNATYFKSEDNKVNLVVLEN